MRLDNVVELALEELQQRSRNRLYRTDPEAWLWDVLGRRWWSKQAEIAHDVVGSGDGQTFTLVKSANGVGKTRLGADLMTWAVSVHDPLDTTVLATANVFSQIKQNAFQYIADNYSDAILRGFELPGRIVSDPAVRLDRGPRLMPKDIIIGRRPSDANLLSSFQGTHDGFVFVLMDEAGGLHEDLWIGANAVTTNKHTAILAIGNPDELNTPFQERFTNEDKYAEWKRHTISAFDTPNFTGEVLYPEDPARDEHVKSYMIQVDWAERMKREAHPNVYLAKVLGEFPKDSSTSFFTQSVIEKATDTEIEPDEGSVKILGVDLAFGGEDKTALYVNHGGRVRKHMTWMHEDDFLKVSHMIHNEALRMAADEVRVDASGSGRGVFSLLGNESEFPDKPYVLRGILGGNASPDLNQWANQRAWHYDTLRRKMQTGEVDLDLLEDTELRDEIVRQPYKMSGRGAIQIVPKSEMRSAGLKSPDHLDAVVYAVLEPEYDEFGSGNVQAGDVVVMDARDLVLHSIHEGAGLPG